MRGLAYIAVALILCSCASRKHIERSVEQTATYNDSSMMASQFVLDSVWRDSSTIVQTIIEFETENREPGPDSGAESALTVASGKAGCPACSSRVSGSHWPGRIKRIVRTEVRRGAAGEVHAERSDSTVNVKELLENSASNEQTYNRIYDIFLLPLFLIFLISFLLFIWVIRRKAGP